MTERCAPCIPRHVGLQLLHLGTAAHGFLGAIPDRWQVRLVWATGEGRQGEQLPGQNAAMEQKMLLERHGNLYRRGGGAACFGIVFACRLSQRVYPTFIANHRSSGMTTKHTMNALPVSASVSSALCGGKKVKWQPYTLDSAPASPGTEQSTSNAGGVEETWPPRKLSQRYERGPYDEIQRGRRQETISQAYPCRVLNEGEGWSQTWRGGPDLQEPKYFSSPGLCVGKLKFCHLFC